MLIKCQADAFVPLEALEDLQGSLKFRSERDMTRLTNSIKEHGFAFPFFVWKSEGKNYILDGHGRYQALLQMQSVGEKIPQLPVVYVQAKNKTDAKNLLLRVNSQYGEVDYGVLNDMARELQSASHDLYDTDGSEFEPNLVSLYAEEIPQREYVAEREYVAGQEVWNPVLDPVIGTRTVTDGAVLSAHHNVLDKSREETLATCECSKCGESILLNIHTINRYLAGLPV
jgi:hypothetical protein